MDRRRGILIAVAALALAVGLAGLAAGSTPRKHSLTVTVVGSGSVALSPGRAVCGTRCTFRLTAGATVRLRARAAAGSRFAGWHGACSGLAACALRMSTNRAVSARFAASAVLRSWNPAFSCTPQLVTIPFVLGSKENAQHGATEAGGGLQPHLRAPADQHLVNPPCSVGGTGTFVEIHDVVVAAQPEHVADGDSVVNMTDPNRPDITNIFMKTIHTEIDDQLFGHHVAPPPQPAKGTHIDIQGFVLWDPGHTDADWHSFSGWEIHSLTAWRPAAK